MTKRFRIGKKFVKLQVRSTRVAGTTEPIVMYSVNGIHWDSDPQQAHSIYSRIEAIMRGEDFGWMKDRDSRRERRVNAEAVDIS